MSTAPRTERHGRAPEGDMESSPDVVQAMPPSSPALPRRLVLYDGTCGLCHGAVRWLIAGDGERRLLFAPLQGATAQDLRQRHPEIPDGLQTVVFLEDGRVFLRSEAVLHAARHLTSRRRWLGALRWIPGFLLDPAYRLVAAVRYRLFGRADLCRLPSPEERARFLP
jgi:predicted DCC family thiol-disulfide oxidoreductase YuxK